MWSFLFNSYAEGPCNYGDDLNPVEKFFEFGCMGSFISSVGLITITILPTRGLQYTSDELNAKDKKVVLRAVDDATLYIATEGEQKGVYLQAANQLLRERVRAFSALDDMELAMMIVNFR